MPDDEVSISASLQGDLAAALADVEQQVDDTGDAAARMGEQGKAAGRAFAAGMDKATRSTHRARDASGKFVPVGSRANETLRDTARDSRIAAAGLDRYAAKARKAARNAGGLGVVLTAVKWAGIATGIYAVVGGLSALAAGGAIAVGGLMPLVGVLAAALPLWAATKLTIAAVKLAGDQLEPTLTRIKNQFVELGPAVAQGGLQQGLDYFADSLERVAALTGRGLASLGKQVGLAAREAGRMAQSAPVLNQFQRIFHGLEPIVGNLTKGFLYLVRALLNVLEAAIPMAQSMAASFASATRRLQLWTAEQLASGRMTAWLNQSWQMFRRTLAVVGDFLVGLFNILRIGLGYSADMGASIEQSATKFRAWTESAEGQARINRYFQESLPALREMGRLLAALLGGFGSLAANTDIAPLLAQMRTELGPAISDLVATIAGQGGLGPATISATAALIRMLAALDFSALTLFLEALAGVINGIMWITANVPGAGVVLSSLLGAFLGFKLLGPVFAMVAGGAKAFAWISAANKMTGQLSMMQKVVGGLVLPMLRTLASFLGGVLLTAIKGIGLALKAAFITSPIGWIVLAIVGLVAGFVLLWTKVAGFRDFFIGVWAAIRVAFTTVVTAIVTAWNAATSALVAAWRATVAVVVAVAMAIWDNGLKQVLGVIVAAFKIAFGIVAFIVQTAVYVIVAIISLVATVMQRFWNGVIYWARLAWDNVIRPIINAFQIAWTAVTTAASAAWNGFITAVTTAWNILYNNAIGPVIGAIKSIWGSLTSGMSGLWTGFIDSVRSAWNILYTNAIRPVIGAIKSIWGSLTSGLSTAFNVAVSAVKAGFNGIKSAAVTVGNIVKGVWEVITSPIKSIWNFLARAWNAIPSITVPDWVPGIGGTTFGLPKLPLLWHGGQAPDGRAIVGEIGPEPVVRDGRVIDIVGQNGPEVASIPRGGYVVPSLDTLERLPGLTRTLPPDVAAAVAGSVPGYGRVLAHDADRAESPRPLVLAGTRRLERALGELTAELRRRPPTVTAETGEVAEEVERVMRKLRREDEIRDRYEY